VSRWPVAGPSEYWLLASSPASKVIKVSRLILVIPRLSFLCSSPLAWSEAAYYARVIWTVIVLNCRYRETKLNHRQTFPFLATEKLAPLVPKPTVLKGTDLVPSTSYPTSYLGLRRMHFNIILSSPSCLSKICSIQCSIVSLSKPNAHPVVILLLSLS